MIATVCSLHRTDTLCRTRLIEILLGVVVFLALTPSVFIPEIVGSSEAREAHIVLDIAWNGNWLAPTRVSEVPSKPPLTHWLAASLVRICSLRPLHAQRLVSLIFAALMVILTALIARHVFPSDRRGAEYRRAGSLLAGVMLSTTYLFVKLATNARVDMAFATFVVCAFYSLVRSHRQSGGEVVEGRAPFFFFICCGLAVFAKGPLGVVLPAMFLYSQQLVLYRTVTAFRKTVLQPGWIVALSGPALWYWATAARGATEVVHRQIFFENVTRFFGGPGISPDPFWFYLPSYVTRGAPWSLCCIALVVISLWRVLRRSDPTRIGLRVDTVFGDVAVLHRRSITLFLLFSLLLFSLSTGKRHSYLLPLYPLFAVLGSYAGCQWYDRQSDYWKGVVVSLIRIGMISVFVVSGILLAVLNIAITFLVDPKFMQSEGLYFSILWLRREGDGLQLFLLVITSLAALGLLLRWPREWRVLFATFLFTALFGACLSFGNGMKSFLRGHFWVAQQIARSVPNDAALILAARREDEELDPVVYYLSERGITLGYQDLEQRREGEGRYLMQGRDFDRLKREGKVCSDGGVVLLQRSGKVKDVLRQRSERDVVLYSCSSSSVNR